MLSSSPNRWRVSQQAHCYRSHLFQRRRSTKPKIGPVLGDFTNNGVLEGMISPNLKGAKSVYPLTQVSDSIQVGQVPCCGAGLSQRQLAGSNGVDAVGGRHYETPLGKRCCQPTHNMAKTVGGNLNLWSLWTVSRLAKWFEAPL